MVSLFLSALSGPHSDSTRSPYGLHAHPMCAVRSDMRRAPLSHGQIKVQANQQSLGQLMASRCGSQDTGSRLAKPKIGFLSRGRLSASRGNES